MCNSEFWYRPNADSVFCSEYLGSCCIHPPKCVGPARCDITVGVALQRDIIRTVFKLNGVYNIHMWKLLGVAQRSSTSGMNRKTFTDMTSVNGRSRGG
jgi:hypothetical protein